MLALRSRITAGEHRFVKCYDMDDPVHCCKYASPDQQGSWIVILTQRDIRLSDCARAVVIWLQQDPYFALTDIVTTL